MQVLKLDFVCTKSEVSEARALSIRKQLGGGSKWRTWLVLGVVLIAVTGALFFQIYQLVAEAYRSYVFGATLVAIVGFVVWKQRTNGRKPSLSNTLEITEDGLDIAVANTQVSFAWSGFSDFVESPALFVLFDKLKTTILVIPKRVFPSESWQTWFRNLANNRPVLPASDAPPNARPATPGAIALKFRLGFRDYLDRALASCFTGSMVLAVAGCTLGLTIYCGAHPPPHAVYSATQVYFYFVVPFTLVMIVMIVLITTIAPWRSHAKHLVPQKVALAEDTISITDAGTEGVLPWSTFKYFKENSRGFIIWRSWRSAWVMLPKRAFYSERSVEECRALLMKRLHYSRWFFD